jgi:1-deoxy-D-xylulose-5-phosphate reductoisomerase
MKSKNIALLGSTGSIGRNSLDVIDANRDRFRLVAIAAGENIKLLQEQIKFFNPDRISVKYKNDADRLKNLFPDKKFYYGDHGIEEIVSDNGIDTVISAISGTSSLAATIISIRNNQRICLANKETLVAAGELINFELSRSRAELIPIDSEQSAIFQSIGANKKEYLKRVILTASGGPFFRRSKREFSQISVKEALTHPTWSMGTKITLDSATLMNKALEIIETHYLFNLNKDQIDVVIHPQSIVHSMVEFIDSSLIAQLSWPDMRIPILYSLSYPERIFFESKGLNLSDLKKLDFYPVDTDKFKSIELAYYVLEMKKNAGAVFNAANEVAAESFLKEEISFNDIFDVVETVVHSEKFYPIHSLDDLDETIKDTKNKTTNYIKRRKPK